MPWKVPEATSASDRVRVRMMVPGEHLDMPLLRENWPEPPPQMCMAPTRLPISGGRRL